MKVMDALNAFVDLLASVAMNLFAVLIFLKVVAPLDGLGRWASVVLLLGAAAALATEAERRADRAGLNG